MKLHTKNAFSLVEVTMALGIAAFALIAVLGLLPVGLSSAQRATEQTVASQIANDIGEDLLAAGVANISPCFKINIPQNNQPLVDVFYLNQVTAPPLESGEDEDTNATPNIGYTRLATNGGARYGVQVVLKKSGINENLKIGSVTVWWPGGALLDKCMGKVSTAVAINDF